MKTFKQFQEGIVSSGLKRLGKVKLFDIAKGGVALYGGKKVLDFLGGGKNKDNPPPPKNKYKKYENPDDGSIPGRYPDESLRDYKIRRDKGLQNAIDKS